MKPVSLAATLACVLGLLGGGWGSSRTVTIETTTTSLTTAAVPGTLSGPAQTTPGAPKATAPPVHLATFRSPSGNLGCLLIGGHRTLRHPPSFLVAAAAPGELPEPGRLRPGTGDLLRSGPDRLRR